jgi:hypothetical protein
MNTGNIDQLIKKYFDGNTSLADEKKLKAYFTSQGLAERHRQYAPLFRLLHSESTKKAPITLDSKLEQIFDIQPARPFFRSRKILWYFSGIAAAVVLMLVIFLTMDQPATPPPELTAKQTQEVLLAYNQTKTALAFVGQNLTKATQPLEKIEKLETAREAIQTLRTIDRKINQVSSNMETFSSQFDNLQQLSKFNIINN